MLRLLLSFMLFVATFGAFYEDSARYWVEKINSDPYSGFKAGYNEYFKGRSFEEISRLMGTYLDTPQLPIKKFETFGSRPKTFTAGVDSWTQCQKTIGFIWDQANCGSCWAVAAAAMASDRTCIVDFHPHNSTEYVYAAPSQPDVGLSSELLMTCCHSCGDGCKGGYPYQAMVFWQHTGLVTGGSYGSNCGCQPYEIAPCHPNCNGTASTPPCKQACRNGYNTTFENDKHHAENAHHIHGHEEHIMEEILHHGPVEAAFSVYMNFIHYTSGVYNHTDGDYLGGHAVKIIGWGEEDEQKYWLINNSWNTTWGDNGQFKFLRGTDLCGMESNIVSGNPKKRDHGVTLQC